MNTPPTVTDRAKGVVAPALAGKMFRLGRYLPPPDLAPFLDHYWIVEWDLQGRPPHTQRTLPYPCAHVVFDRARTGIWGLTTGSFDYELKDAGKVCGLRFRAGAFRGLLGRPLHTITDKVLALSDVFPWDETAAQDAVLDTPDDTAMIEAAGTLLRSVLPAPDPQVDRIAAILRAVESTPGLTQVEELAAVQRVRGREPEMGDPAFSPARGGGPAGAGGRHRPGRTVPGARLFRPGALHVGFS
jgi:hypothetical protein